MQEAFAVTGRVVDEGSSELGVAANVVVRSVSGLEPSRRAVSGADGSFQVDGLLAGRWIADASAPGYLDSSAQAFAAESKTALLLKLDSGGEVSGVVESAQGGAVAGATVQLVGTSTSGVERRYSGAQAVVDSVSTLASGQRFLPRGELGVLLGPIPLVPPPGAYVSRVATTVSSAEGSVSRAEGSVSPVPKAPKRPRRRWEGPRSSPPIAWGAFTSLASRPVPIDCTYRTRSTPTK